MIGNGDRAPQFIDSVPENLTMLPQAVTLEEHSVAYLSIEAVACLRILQTLYASIGQEINCPWTKKRDTDRTKLKDTCPCGEAVSLVLHLLCGYDASIHHRWHAEGSEVTYIEQRWSEVFIRVEDAQLLPLVGFKSKLGSQLAAQRVTASQSNYLLTVQT